jgi:hypothetical protein
VERNTSVAILLALALAVAGCFGADELPEDWAAESTDGPRFTATTGSVTGLVVTENLEPVKAARVSLSADGALAAQAETDARGRYALNDLEPGTYRLQVSATCCHEQVRGGVVEANRHTQVDALLRPFTAAELDLPYVEPLVWNGLMSCGVGLVLYGFSLCPWDPNDDTTMSLDLSAGLEAVVFGLEWAPFGGLGKRMAVSVHEVCSDGSGQVESCHTYARMEGDSPLVFVIESPDDEWSFADIGSGRTIRFGVSPASDAGAFWQQQFTLHYHLFFNHTPPEGYNPIADA